MPGDALPPTKSAVMMFGRDPVFLAGDFVISWARKRIMSDAEIEFISKYLSQDPQGRFELPDILELRNQQCLSQLHREMGDVSQGVAQCYWDLGNAKVSVMLYEITDGRLEWVDGEVVNAG
jgi:hypothetical protein